MSDLILQRGNPYTATITITNNGAVYDITGMTVLFTVKSYSDRNDDDSAALIQKDITIHTNPTTGITTLSLSDSDTDISIGSYRWDIRLYKNGVIQTNSSAGNCIVSDIVTKRT